MVGVNVPDHPTCNRIDCPGKGQWQGFTRMVRPSPDKCSHPAFTGPLIDEGEGSCPTCIFCGASEDSVKRKP